MTSEVKPEPLTVTLRNGVSMPKLGLGTSHHGGYNHESILYALKECGYRMIDTATRYGVEAYLGCAFAESGLQREDLFLTTKLWLRDYGLEKCQRAAKQSIQRLQADYLDLYLLHCPPPVTGTDPKPRETLFQTWRGLELLLESEQCRAIGVANFQEEDLEALLEECCVTPHVNQCEFHPYQNPKALRTFCSENRIVFEGHCPLAKGKLLSEEPVVKISKELGKKPAEVLIAWALQNDVVTIPKSTNRQRLLENYQAQFTRLPEPAMATLNSLHRDLRIIDLERFSIALGQNLPDGYKISQYPSVLPPHG